METLGELNERLRAKFPGRELAQYIFCMAKGALYGVDRTSRRSDSSGASGRRCKKVRSSRAAQADRPGAPT
jgi:hypothetical protein